MQDRHLQYLLPLFLVSWLAGCSLNTAVIQRGGNGRKGVLLNYSCGAHPCDAIDPAKPTIVLTHGWNPLPNKIRTTFGSSGAQALKCRCGDRYNLLSWDWNAVRVSPFQGEPFRIGRCQGKMLAAALRARGVNPSCTQMIGHSLGTAVIAQAAVCLSDLGPMSQLTLLDPPTKLHEELFCRLQAQHHARVVENYWAPGISGYGSEANYRGVRNFKVENHPAPMRGMIDISSSNHVNTMLWYYKTMCNPALACGFQNSILRGCCGHSEGNLGREHPISVEAQAQGLAPQTSEVAEISAGSRKR